MPEPAETENPNKNEDDEEIQCEPLHDLLDMITGVQRVNLVDESVPAEPRPRMYPLTLSVILMNYQWSREQKWNKARVSTVFILTSRKTQIVISA